MATTPCFKRMREGMMVDLQHVNHRLDTIESQLEELCGLLVEIVERIDRGQRLIPPGNLDISQVFDNGS